MLPPLVLGANNLPRERSEYRVYQSLLRMVPALEERLLNGSGEEILHVADLVCHTSPITLMTAVHC